MDELDKEMKMSFIEEARQLLDDCEQSFLDLEAHSGDSQVLENLFRLAHNIKGTSRAVGFGEVAEFTHQLENLLLKLKNRELQADDETVDLLLACNDHLRVMVDGLGADMGARFDSRDLLAKLTTKLEGGSIGSSGGSHESEGPSAADVAALTGADATAHDAGEIEQDVSGASAQWLQQASAAPVVAGAAGPAPMHESSGGGGAKKAAAAQQQDESIRVSLSRLETLSDFIGELVILQTVLNQHRHEVPSDLLQKTIAQLGKISKEIQDIAMSLRMIPLKQTFAKLQRIVRDTSKALGKTVELTLEGDQTEVDKTVLEHLGDPLVHIVRNAIDHGLEMPADRAAAGKAESGNVLIAAYHQGNNLVIEIRDDGHGIDGQKILRKAIEKGVVPPGTAMSDHDARQLIFAPGFSTKDQVSEISGRGVGMDVVKTNVERLGGQVQLESELGKGSTFRVVLPLTLAIVDAMVVVIGEERYVVPVANVQETVQPKTEDVHFITGRGEVLTLRDQPIPLFRLRNLLRLPPEKNGPRDAHGSIAIIANSRTRPFAVLVDDILRQQQIVIKKLGPEYRNQKGLTGSAILGDGKPALIVDLNDLVDNRSAAGASKGGASTFSGAA